jgi:hypothetical protein
MLTVVPDGCPGHEGRKDASPSLIEEIVREGARRMLAEALRAEVDAYIARFADQRGEDGRRLAVRNGYHMAFKLIQAAQDHRRAVNAPHLVALVWAGARFDRGALIERPEPAAA